MTKIQLDRSDFITIIQGSHSRIMIRSPMAQVHQCGSQHVVFQRNTIIERPGSLITFAANTSLVTTRTTERFHTRNPLPTKYSNAAKYGQTFTFSIQIFTVPYSDAGLILLHCAHSTRPLR
jgi:hypothetical protein